MDYGIMTIAGLQLVIAGLLLRLINGGGGRERLERLERTMREESDRLRLTIHQTNEAILGRLAENTGTQLAQLEIFSRQLQALTMANEQKLERMRDTLEVQVKALQEDNGKKLDLMRQTVDEKLHATLEKRLGESFQIVSDRLELVHRGLGEMQTLAAGVGDLKRVLTNVKTRGTWGEIQLEALLDQVLAPEQFVRNVVTRPGSNERVEFAIVLPGKEDKPVYLPIDAKYPQEDYHKMLDAQDTADPALAEAAGKAMEVRIKAGAKDIRDKYICPPHTTDFGLLFLPVEGLYAEVLRRPGLCEALMRDYHVTVAGPTTLAAFLNSLQMGFRTLAVEKRSSEVWSLLGAVKGEFGKFGDLLDKTNKKLQEASNAIDDATRKTRTIERRLKNVEVSSVSGPNLIELESDGEDERMDNRPSV